MSFDCSSKSDYFVLFTFWLSLCRSSRPKVFCKKGALRNFTKFTWKRLCRSLFLNKVAGLRPATLFKKGLWHRCFFVTFAKFLRIPFLTEHLWWLLLFVFIQVGQMIMLKNGDLDITWTFYIKKWSGINFWSVIQNGTFFLKFFIHLQSRSLR